jgi:cobyrinic acid a,c-diamide synthase
MMAANVFLSYAMADQALAAQVAQSLEKSGIDAPLFHVGVYAGDGFPEQIRKGLQNSDAVVIVLSDASINNGFVMAELGAALALNKRIVAIKPSLSPLEISLPATPSIETLTTEGMSADEIATAIRNHLAN